MSGHAEKYAIKYAKHVAAAYLAAPLMFITNMLNKQITTAPFLPSPSSPPPCTWIALEVIVYEAPPHTHTHTHLIGTCATIWQRRQLPPFDLLCPAHLRHTLILLNGAWQTLEHVCQQWAWPKGGGGRGICSIFAWRFLRIFFLSLLENIFVP